MTRKENTDLEEMKRYLYREMSDDGRDAVEERFFDDDAYFYELLDLENDLTDRYVRRELAGAEKLRFERGLRRVPERRQKVASALALQHQIEVEKEAAAPRPAVVAPRVSWWEKLRGMFALQSPAFAYGMAGLLLVTTLASAWLFYDAQRTRQELAQARAAQDAELSRLKREVADLTQAKAQAEQRQADVQTQKDATSEQLADANAQLEQANRTLAQAQRKVAEASARRPTGRRLPGSTTFRSKRTASNARISAASSRARAPTPRARVSGSRNSGSRKRE
jgi:DNA repair exonuclease SbcCD ATPase subunit